MIEYKDLRVAYDIYKNSIWLKYQKNIKSLFGDISERAAELALNWQEWRTNVHVPMQQEMIDSMFAHIIDSTWEFTVEVIWEDPAYNAEPKTVENYLNYIYEQGDAFSKMKEVLQDWVPQGIGYLKVVWRQKKDVVEYYDWTKTKEAELYKEDIPGIKWLNIFSVIVDPTATSLKKARWIAERNFLNWWEILSEYHRYFKWKTEDELKSLYKRKYTDEISEWIIENVDLSLVKQQILLNISNDPANTDIELTSDDKAMEVVEIMDRKWNVKLYVWGVLMHTGKSMYPFDWYPIHSFTYDKQTGTFLWLGICDKTQWYQELINILYNTHADNVKLSGTPAFLQLATPWQNMFEWDTTLDVSPMKVFNVETPDGIKPLDLKIQDNMLEELQYIKQSAQTSVGINEMVMWVQGKIERSAAATNSLMQSFKARMRPLFNSVSDTMAEIGRQWLYMTIAFTNAEDMIGVKVEREDGTYEIKQLKWEDLHGKWRIKFEIAWLNTSMREIEKKQLQEMLPIAQSMVDANGKPLMNMREAMQRIAELYNLKQSFVMPVEEAQPQGQMPLSGWDPLQQNTLQQWVAPVVAPSEPSSAIWGWDPMAELMWEAPSSWQPVSDEAAIMSSAMAQ